MHRSRGGGGGGGEGGGAQGAIDVGMVDFHKLTRMSLGFVIHQEHSTSLYKNAIQPLL